MTPTLAQAPHKGYSGALGNCPVGGVPGDCVGLCEVGGSLPLAVRQIKSTIRGLVCKKTLLRWAWAVNTTQMGKKRFRFYEGPPKSKEASQAQPLSI